VGEAGTEAERVAGIPITRHWLIPHAQRPKVYAPHPVMTADEIRARTQAVWIDSTVFGASGSARGARRRCARASPLSSFLSSIGKCTRTRVSRPTARA
jgi:hypothetical protein